MERKERFRKLKAGTTCGQFNHGRLAGRILNFLPVQQLPGNLVKQIAWQTRKFRLDHGAPSPEYGVCNYLIIN